MLCPSCGTEVGEEVQLCANCAAKRAAREKAEQEEKAKLSPRAAKELQLEEPPITTPADGRPQTRRSQMPIKKPFSLKKWLISGPLSFTLLFLSFFIPIWFIIFLETRHNASESVLLTLLYLGAFMWFTGHIILLVECFQHHMIFGILGLAVPPIVYLLIFVNWYKGSKPFFLALVGIVFFSITFTAFVEMTERDRSTLLRTTGEFLKSLKEESGRWP